MNTRSILMITAGLLLLGAGCVNSTAQPVKSSTVLNLSGSGLTQVSLSVFDQTSLETLDVSENRLTGALPSQIGQLKNLRVLDASKNQMTGVPAEVGQLSKLEELDLSDNQLTGLPFELGNLTNLKRLDLRGNTVSSKDLEGIRAKLTGTEILE